MTEHAPLMYSRTSDRKFSRESLLAFQHGLCAGCFDPESWTLHVDHDHATGLIRALLCPSCNAGEGSRVYDWAAFVADTPAAQFHRGVPSALPSFVARAEKVEAEQSAYVIRSWRCGFRTFAEAVCEEEHKAYQRWDHPQDGNHNPVFNALYEAYHAERLRIHAIVERAVRVDSELLETAGDAGHWNARRIHSDVSSNLLSAWYRAWWDAREQEMCDRMAESLPMHAFQRSAADDPHCAFVGCGIKIGAHPSYRGIDEDYPALARVRERLALLRSIESQQAAA